MTNLVVNLFVDCDFCDQEVLLQFMSEIKAGIKRSPTSSAVLNCALKYIIIIVTLKTMCELSWSLEILSSTTGTSERNSI